MWKRLWRTSPELMATAALMVVVLAGAGVGLAIDPTIVPMITPMNMLLMSVFLHAADGGEGPAGAERCVAPRSSP